MDGTTQLRGTELLLRFIRDGFTVTGSYVLVDADEPDPSSSSRRAVPLTPKHTAGLVGIWEKHGKGRIGVEPYHTGEQVLKDNPYRTRSRPYLHLGTVGEITLGGGSLFANAENLLDVGQTSCDPSPSYGWPQAGGGPLLLGHRWRVFS